MRGRVGALVMSQVHAGGLNDESIFDPETGIDFRARKEP